MARNDKVSLFLAQQVLGLEVLGYPSAKKLLSMTIVRFFLAGIVLYTCAVD